MSRPHTTPASPAPTVIIIVVVAPVPAFDLILRRWLGLGFRFFWELCRGDRDRERIRNVRRFYIYLDAVGHRLIAENRVTVSIGRLVNLCQGSSRTRDGEADEKGRQ